MFGLPDPRKLKLFVLIYTHYFKILKLFGQEIDVTRREKIKELSDKLDFE
jgi:hypothetical protein